jgi:Ca2+-binding RTX toxin-like protein
VGVWRFATLEQDLGLPLSDILAFPGAGGFGAETIGGRGGAVVTVTNLNDSGVGSLRWAVEEVQGPRTIVFAVNGVIKLTSQITINDPYVTIAGQTAPGAGIVLTGAKLHVEASEVVVRGLTMHPGDGVGESPGVRDGLFIGTTETPIHNVVIDHNSIAWGIDENFSINGNVNNVTFSNNIVAEGLSQSIHPEGEHSKGVLISNWGSTDPQADSHISLIANLIASNFARNPEVKAGQFIEIINNWSYNYALAHLAFAVGGANGGTLAITVNAIGNVFQPGPDTPNYKVPIAFQPMGAGSAVYLSDNLWTKLAVDANGDQDQTKLAWNNGGLQYRVAQAAFATSEHTQVLDSQDVRTYVADNVGASPYDRGTVDTRIVQSALDGTGGIIDSSDEVGGEPFNRPVRAAADSDLDGLPDWFESLYGFDAGTADSNGDNDGDGYTNLEEYINGIYTGFDLPLAKALVAAAGATGQADIFSPIDGSGLMLLNFDAAEGDRINLSPLLAGYDPTQAPLSDFVEITGSSGNTVISVDRDGEGGDYGWEFVASLLGVTDLDGDYSILAGSPVLFLSGGTLSNGDAYDEIIVTGPPFPWLTDLSSGGGDDRILLAGQATTGSIDGGDGLDRLVVTTPEAANLSGIAISHVEALDTGGTTVIATAEQLGGFATIVRSADSPASQVELTLAAAGAVDLSSRLEERSVIFTGSDGDDAITTSSGGDTISALNGNDQVWGGGGTDTVYGGDGNDVVYGGDGGDTLDGGDGDDILYGENGADLLLGGAGNDVLYGGLVGDNTLRGGPGADIYYIDNPQDGINERFGQTVDDGAIDIVYARGSRTLTKYVDNLFLLGSDNSIGTGNEINNVIVGNDGANVIFGADGDDTLSGGDGADTISGGNGRDILDGNAGRDILKGDAGDDLYILVDNDTIIELAGAGRDTVRAAIDYVLTDNVEVLLLTGEARSGGGNDQDNEIHGNALDNTLEGGAGADLLDGGDGLDIASYAGSAAAVNVDLGAGVGHGGDAAGDQFVSIEGLSGSAFDDVLVGDDKANLLNGGAGHDILAGGKGDDTYVASDDDQIVETAAEGVDTVVAALSYTLGENLENLLLGGEASIDGFGNALANRIVGNGASNLLVGGAGADTLDGQGGLDTASYATSASGVEVDLSLGVGKGGDAEGDLLRNIEILIGSAFADILRGDARDNLLIGAGGGDRIFGGDGVDTVDYSASAAVKVNLGLAETVRQVGGDANGDMLSGVEQVIGSRFDDWLTGDAAANRLSGGDGNDNLDGGAGADTLIGGTGNDQYVVDDAGDVVVEIGGGLDQVSSSISYALGADIERLVLIGAAAIDGQGNALDNVVTGNEQANVLWGFGGRDTLSGLGGDDVIHGGQGADKITGGAGLNTLFGDEGDDTITGGDQKDVIDGGDGADQITGGGGDDEIAGSAGRDMIRGGLGADFIDGGGDKDTLFGDDGDDRLLGGDDADKLDGGLGADLMEGGAGADIYYVDDLADVVMESALDRSVDTVYSSVDFKLGDNVEFLVMVGDTDFIATGNGLTNQIITNGGRDVIHAGANADIVWAGGGDDLIYGDDGTDKLFGQDGDDTIHGGVGSDLIQGGRGADILYGETSKDIFSYLATYESTLASSDVIADFDVTDVIDLSAIDADETLAGNQAFSFIGEAVFSGAGQIRYFIDDAGRTIVQVETNGMEGADMQIVLPHYPLVLNSGDFLL